MWGKVFNKNGEPNPSIHKFIRGEKQYMNRNFNGTLQSDGLHVEDCCRQNWMNDVMLVFVRSFIEFYSKYSPHSGAHGTTHTTVRRFTQTISVICVNMCAVECSCYDPHISVAMVRLHVTCLPVSFVCVWSRIGLLQRHQLSLSWSALKPFAHWTKWLAGWSKNSVS